MTWKDGTGLVRGHLRLVAGGELEVRWGEGLGPRSGLGRGWGDWRVAITALGCHQALMLPLLDPWMLEATRKNPGAGTSNPRAELPNSEIHAPKETFPFAILVFQ